MFIPDLRSRNRLPELMDDPSLDRQQHQIALRGLARIHRFTFSAARFWSIIQAKFSSTESNDLTVMDVGCGDGYILRQLFTLARQRGLNLKIVGCDFSAAALEFAARLAATENIPLELHQTDVTVESLPRSADIVISSLFLHHFDREEVVRILGLCNAASARGVIIEDLRRTALGYGLCWLGTRTFTRSSIVHTDSLLSVAAAFSISEIEPLAKAAGLQHFQIEKCWPQRFVIHWPSDGDGHEST